MKILVIGCGSIGRRHIRLLKEMGMEVAGFEANAERAEEAKKATGVGIYHSTEPTPWRYLPLLSSFDGVIVATPNHLHARPAQAALECGRPVLIEKPITTTAHDAEILLSEAKTPILVGYCLRHHPGLRRVKELLDKGAIGTVRHASIHFGSYLPDWRPGFDYRQGYAASREQGGGILLDASHEIDLANWFFGKPERVMAMVRNTGALPGLETEDLADLLIDYGEVQVSVHVDYLARDYRRGCVIIGDKGTFEFNMHPNNWGLGRHPEGIYEGGQVDRDAMYRAELEHFVRVLEGREYPACTGQDGLSALKVVEAARKSAEVSRAVYL